MSSVTKLDANVDNRQMGLFESALARWQPATTRYQGSKLKLLDWIWSCIGKLEFQSALEAFGGTGCVSHRLKWEGKSVTYNDYLKFNQLIGVALVENSHIRLSEDDLEAVINRDACPRYDDFIERTFPEIYFTTEENRWLDAACQNICRLSCSYRQAIAYFGLFQACIAKRPYNLFHRKNLYIRTADVKRGFGNKTTWDTPFEDHFRKYVGEANQAVFDSGVACRAVCGDAASVGGDFDLVYIDPPYISSKGVGVDYRDFYHFLEGLVDYETWPKRLDRSRKHLPLRSERSPWCDSGQILNLFEKLFERYSESTLVVSYRSDGIPSEEELVGLLKRYKRHVRSHHFGGYKYVLSTNDSSREILLIGE